MKAKLFAMLMAGTASIGTAPSAQAYPIDCAILLCLAGGFPASAECGAAKAELIRRITPWPIEPPLQLWRCPMGGGNVSMPGVGADGLTPEVRKYRSEIEVWQVSKTQTGSGSGGRDYRATAARHYYDANGGFRLDVVSPQGTPEWVNDELRSYTGHAFTNRMGYIDEYGAFRGVLLRTQDHAGNYHTEWVAY